MSEAMEFATRGIKRCLEKECFKVPPKKFKRIG